MASSSIKPGILVSLQDLYPSSPFFKQGASLRVTGKLQEYSVEAAIAVIVDGSCRLKIDTRHLRDLNLRIGSIYQFIGELLIQSNNEVKGIHLRTFLPSFFPSQRDWQMLFCTLSICVVLGNSRGTGG
uniref:CST complex subunit TEN1 n=1 Tax=Nelumbo nucifera TaxID=4432 RepID=A0A822YKV8_NELNU|nr:TPA_asm: hypothetical protein HUJ06_012081 [Nelumbo nucifera]